MKRLVEEIRRYNPNGEVMEESILSYLCGKIDIEELKLENNTFRAHWFKGIAKKIELADQVLSNKESLDQVELTTDELNRIMKFYFKYVETYDQYNLIKTFSRDGILKIYPEYMLNIKDFIEDSIEDSFEIDYKLVEVYEDLFKEVLSENNKLKKNGKFIGEHNLLCLLTLRTLKNTIAEGKIEKIDEEILETIEILADDYCIKDYVGRQNKDTEKYRRSISNDTKQALLEFLKGVKDLETTAELLKKSLYISETGESKRREVAFIEVDEEFTSLYNIARDTKGKSIVAKRLMDLVEKVSPHYHMTKNRFVGARKNCHWGEVNKFFKILEAEIIKTPEQEKELVEYAVVYTVEHLNCNRKNHIQIMKKLIEEYGDTYIIDRFKPRSTSDERIGYHLIGSYSKDQRIEEKLSKNKVKSFRKLVLKITSTEESRELVYNYLRGDRKKKINLKKILNITKDTKIGVEPLYLTEDGLKNYVQLVLESKNKIFITSLVEKGMDVNRKEIFLKKILDVSIESKSDIGLLLRAVADESAYWMKRNKGESKFYYMGDYYDKNPIRENIGYLEDNGVKCIELSRKYPAGAKTEVIAGAGMSKQALEEVDELILNLGGKEKGIREEAYITLKNYKKRYDISELAIINTKLYDSACTCNDEQEINSVELLIENKYSHEKLNELYSKLVEARSRELILTELQIELVEAVDNFDIDEYIDKIYNPKKKLGVDLEEFMLPIRLDGKAPYKAIEVFMHSYKGSDETTINREGRLIAEIFEKDSFEKFVREIFEYWMNKKDAKNKWLLIVALIHGDKSLLDELIEEINSFADNSRIKVAIYMTKALALRGDDKSLVAVDKIRRKTKYKTLREGAEEALNLASKELGISRYELGDTLISNVGFDSGYLSMKYVDEDIKIILCDDLSIVIERANGKRVKTLPKKDGGAEEKNGKDYMKELKKILKEEVNTQKERLEEGFVEFRIWNGANFKDILSKKVVSKSIASNLIWGIYSDGKLTELFYVDGNIFRSVDDKEIAIDDSDSISLVHISEIDIDVAEVWIKKQKELMKDNFLDQLIKRR